jgi:hypothetical protein
MNNHSVEIDIQTGDAKDIETDLLVLKSAKASSGVGKEIAQELTPENWKAELPHHGKTKIFECGEKIGARYVLYIGVGHVTTFDYQNIRQFTRRALEIARNESVHDDLNTKHITFTLHGPGYGLDEKEAFESELAGLMEAIREGNFPQELEQISFVEINPSRAKRLEAILTEFVPGAVIEKGEPTTEKARAVGYDSQSKPHVFVAMPFADEFEDVYHLGIAEAVRSAGFLCERIDKKAFTGGIPDRIQERIEDASLVVADMTHANPNVYLEVGYAWGKEVPTLLLTQETDDLTFDVQHHNSIIYERHAIRELREELENTISNLMLSDNNGF